MKVVASTVLVFFILIAAPVSAQDYPIPPSEEHNILKAEVGTWGADISIFMGPGDPVKSKGVEIVKPFGELWNIVDFEYDYMGNPTQSHGTFGYDPQQKKYTGTWHESGSPYTATLEGDYDAESKKMTYLMNGKNPDGSDTTMKLVTTYVDDTHKTFEMFAKMPGAEEMTRMLEIKYTKQAEK